MSGSNTTEIWSEMQKDTLRIIYQHLKNVGLNCTAEELVNETKLQLEFPAAVKLEAHVMEGNWQNAETDLIDLEPLLENPDSFVEMKFLLLEQKYMELLEEDRTVDALFTLSQQITPLDFNKDRVHELTTYMMCNTVEELMSLSKWDGQGLTSRRKLMEKLKALLPPHVMLPPERLQTLLHQAVQLQKERCQYHCARNTSGLDDVSLLINHSCSKKQLPSRVVQVLQDHDDEVWFCQFSNDGTKLATGSKDTTVRIWDVNQDTLELSHRTTFTGHPSAVSFLCWSPDDKCLIACSPGGSPDFWVWNLVTGNAKLKMTHSHGNRITAAAWHSSGQKFIAGCMRGPLYECDTDGNLLEIRKNIRALSLWYWKDGKTILAADGHSHIKAHNIQEHTSFIMIQENHDIVSFTCDDSGELALLNVVTQGVNLWDIENRVCMQQFRGVKQGDYVIHSCFGGVNQMFVASGSEDKNIYIWHIKHAMPVAVLCDHTSAVNCVTWNPVYPGMLASASDDGTVKIWGPSEMQQNSNAGKNVV